LILRCGSFKNSSVRALDSKYRRFASTGDNTFWVLLAAEADEADGGCGGSGGGISFGFLLEEEVNLRRAEVNLHPF
jgi:hypothetical protein